MTADGKTRDDPSSGLTEFVGGVDRGFFGWRVTAPFGHLAFDTDSIRIWGGGNDQRLARSEVREVHLRGQLFSTGVRIILTDGSTAPVRFSGVGREAFRVRLQERGWPVVG